MRDPKRIKPLLKKIEDIWTQSPDLRLCQLIGNCFHAGDLYYVEDSNLDEKLSTMYKTQLLRAEKKVKRKPYFLYVILLIVFILFAVSRVFACDEVIINAKENWLQSRTLKRVKEVDSTAIILRNEYNVLLIKTKNNNFCTDLQRNKRKNKTAKISCSCNLPVQFLDDEPNIVNDTFYPYQWNLKAVHVDEAWTLSTGSDDTYVAVLDSGIDYDSKDLESNIWQKDYLNVDRYYHGTAVASIIASQGNDEYGLAGINWKTNVIPVKMLGDIVLTYDLISGMNWVIQLHSIGIPIRAMNASYGRLTFDQTEYDIIQKAQNEGIILVAAAGNNNFNVDLDKKLFPAAYDLENIISVGSINEDFTKSSFSNYGQGVDILAPGGSVYIGKPGNIFTKGSGTSFSAPHVTGAITLLDSYTGGYLSWQELKWAILESATQHPELSEYAFNGRVLNVYEALKLYQYNPYKPIASVIHNVKVRLTNRSKLKVKIIIKNNITGQLQTKVTRKRNYDIKLPRGFYTFSIANKNIRRPNWRKLKYDIFLINDNRILFTIVPSPKKKK